MTLLFILAFSAQAFTYDALRAASPERASKLMTEQGFSAWTVRFKKAREEVASCVKLSASQLPGLINPLVERDLDKADGQLYKLGILNIAGRLEADVAFMTGDASHDFEKSNCDYKAKAANLAAASAELQAHARAVEGGFIRLADRTRFFPAMTEQQRRAWLEGGYLEDFKEAVRTSIEHGDFDVVRAGFHESSAYRPHLTSWALADLQDERFSDEMKEFLDSRDRGQRREAVFFFYSLGDRSVKDKIVSMSDDPYDMVRVLVAEYIGSLRLAEHRETVEKLTADHVDEVRATAHKNLKLLP